jgi:hypothetical protein
VTKRVVHGVNLAYDSEPLMGECASLKVSHESEQLTTRENMIQRSNKKNNPETKKNETKNETGNEIVTETEIVTENWKSNQ